MVALLIFYHDTKFWIIIYDATEFDRDLESVLKNQWCLKNSLSKLWHLTNLSFRSFCYKII